MDETPIRIRLGDAVLTGRLRGNPTAEDLLAQLPLTLTFKDFNGVEKIATLPRPLSLEGAPAAAAPDAGDIAFYAPTNDLVLYYRGIDRWPGIVPIGRFDGPMDRIEQQSAAFEVTIERG